MKTVEPLQGIIMCASHNVIHLALLIAQPLCFKFFGPYACEFDRNLHNSTFMFVHAWCFICTTISTILNRLQFFELSRVFEVSKVPLYIWFIYQAHFYELNHLIHNTATCENKRVDLLFQWYIVELRVFYGYILAGIVFLMVSQLVGINKNEKNPSVHSLTGAHGEGDFIEKYIKLKVQFCLHTFEIISTLIMIVEYYSSNHSVSFNRPGTYIVSIIILVVYGFVTAAQAFHTFKKFSDDFHTKMFFSLHAVRFGLMVASTVLLFTQEGQEAQFGMWILTNAVLFIVDTCYWACQKTLKKYENILCCCKKADKQNKTSPRDFNTLDIPEEKKTEKNKLAVINTKKRSQTPDPVSFKLHTEPEISIVPLEIVQVQVESDQQSLSVSHKESEQKYDHLEHHIIINDGHGHKMLHLKEDFYAVSFVGMTTKIELDYELSSQTQGRNFYACCFIFCLQMVLVILIFKSVIFDVDHFVIYTPSVSVFLCRFICTILLHIELIEDVKQGIQLLFYLNTHPEAFSQPEMAFTIAAMQLVGGFSAEIANLFMLATRSSVEYCVTFFVAFHMLTTIDNIYAEGVSDFALLSALHEPLVFEKDPKKIPFKKRSFGQKCLRILIKVIMFFYNSVYYYYLPFAINFVPYISAGDPANMVAH